MENLVTIKNDQPVTTSLNVAKSFNRNHRDVLLAIRNLFNDVNKNSKNAVEASNNKKSEKTLLLNRMFLEDKYTVENNVRSYPMFYMNKDGFTLLVMGFNGHKATQFKLQYIAQFNRMAEQIKQNKQMALPRNYPDALRQLAEKVEENEQLKAQIEAQTREPEQLELSQILYTTEEIAESCGFSSARLLNKELNKQRIIYWQKGLWHLYYPYKNKGYKDTSTRHKSQMWTAKGKRFIESRTAKDKRR